MNCTDFLHRYSDYDDSLLDEAELASFRRHLASCASCARYDRVLRKGRMLARHHSAVTPAADFMPRLQHRLWQQRVARRHRFATAVPGGPAAALAAVTVILTSLWAVSLLDHADPVHAVVDAMAPAETEGVESVEPSASWWSGGGWTASVPVMEPPEPRDWGASRVDPRVPVAYSPLVTGPPTYRVQHAFQASAIMSTGHTLD
jgi:anti-sigma factor RsiW